MSFLFGKKVSPEEKAREWGRQLKREQRQCDREVRALEREEMKIKMELKRAAKKNQVSAVKTYAKAIVRSQNAKNQLLETKARIGSVGMQLKQQVAMLKVSKHMQKSAGVMKAMNKLVNLPKISETMRAMSKEMVKAGIIEDMLEDNFAMMDGDEVEEDAEEEINKVIDELTNGQFGTIADIKNKELAKQKEEEEAMKAAAEEDKELLEMRARLEGI